MIHLPKYEFDLYVFGFKLNAIKRNLFLGNVRILPPNQLRENELLNYKKVYTESEATKGS